MDKNNPPPRSLIGLALAITLALLLPHSQTHAQTLICRSRSIDMLERARLRTAMQEALPAGVTAEGIPDICINPSFARASMDTPPRLRTDGATEWWTVRCARKARKWTCDTPEHNQLIWVYTDIKGQQRRLEVSFDDATGLARARSLAVRAEKIFQDETAQPPEACQSPFGLKSTETQTNKARDEWRASQRSMALTPQDIAVEVTVDSDEPGAFSVSHGGWGTTLIFTETNDRSATSPVCWAEIIVVT